MIIRAAKEISASPKSPVQKHIFDIINLAWNTGMRKSEIFNLKWKDVKEWSVTVEGKGGRVRQIPLNVRAKAAIIKQPKKSEYIFDIPNRHQKDLIRRTVGQIKKRTGIGFHFHLLRHYFATKLIEKGIDLITISAILGHSSKMTSLVYSHTDKERMKKAVDSLVTK